MTEQQSTKGRIFSFAGLRAQTNIPKAASTFCLIVDDEKGIRNLIARALRSHMVMTEACGDAGSALEALKLRTPDLIFLDISLERSDAVEVIRGLGELDYRGAVQLMSGRDRNFLEDIKRVGEKYKLKMLPVLQKPFRIELIPAILAAAGIASKTEPGPTVGLFEALCAGWVDLCYQPKVVLQTQKLIGAEGFVRVVHPKRGVLPSASVFADADEASLLALAECSLQCALSDWTEFSRAGNALRLSINVPMVALQKLSIPAIVRDRRPTTDRWPGLILEVSEDQILSDLSLAHEMATQLSIYDIHIAIDRCGPGSSVLTSLSAFPFAELKISSSFASGCANNEANAAVCRALVDIAHRFDRLAVAEGIDSPQDMKLLSEMGCDTGQGAYFGRPVAKEALCAIIGQKAAAARAL